MRTAELVERIDRLRPESDPTAAELKDYLRGADVWGSGELAQITSVADADELSELRKVIPMARLLREALAA